MRNRSYLSYTIHAEGTLAYWSLLDDLLPAAREVLDRWTRLGTQQARQSGRAGLYLHSLIGVGKSFGATVLLRPVPGGTVLPHATHRDDRGPIVSAEDPFWYGICYSALELRTEPFEWPYSNEGFDGTSKHFDYLVERLTEALKSRTRTS